MYPAMYPRSDFVPHRIVTSRPSKMLYSVDSISTGTIGSSTHAANLTHKLQVAKWRRDRAHFDIHAHVKSDGVCGLEWLPGHAGLIHARRRVPGHVRCIAGAGSEHSPGEKRAFRTAQAASTLARRRAVAGRGGVRGGYADSWMGGAGASLPLFRSPRQVELPRRREPDRSPLFRRADNVPVDLCHRHGPASHAVATAAKRV